MTSPTASLLQHLLTSSDLAQLEIPASQVEAWLGTRSLAPVGELPSAGADAEQVFSVTDAALRRDLAVRLAAAGKPIVLLSPQRIRSFLRRAASGAVDAAVSVPGSVTAAVSQLPDDDFAELFAAAVAELDGDLEIVMRLAAEEATVDAKPPAANRAHTRELTDTEESMLLDNPVRRRNQETTEWFDTAELEAAMGTLAGATDEAAGGREPLNDLVPLAEEDLEELGAIVAFHSEQLERLADLPHSIDLLARRVEQLRRTVQDGEPLPASTADQVALGATPSTCDGRRTSLLAIALALVCWSGLIWFGTGSATLALVSLAAANVIGFFAVQPLDRRR